MVASGASEQSMAINNLTENVKSLDKQIGRIVDNTNGVAGLVDETNLGLEDGGRRMNELESAKKIQGAYFTNKVCTLSICYRLISIRSRIICKLH